MFLSKINRANCSDSDSVLKAGTRAALFQNVGKFVSDDVALKLH
jgi:hypothetical protein